MELTNTVDRSFSSPVRPTILRFATYTIGFLLLAVALPLFARYKDAAVFKENGAVEWAQLICLLSVSALYLREAIGSLRYRHIFIVLACVSTFAAVREMDANLDPVIPLLGWKIGYVFILLAGFVGYSNKIAFQEQAAEFLNSRAFSLLWAGFIVAIPFAQLVGNSTFLQALMSVDYNRDYSRMIEEIAEFMGYGLLLIGSFELVSQTRTNAPPAGRTFVMKDALSANHWS